MPFGVVSWIELSMGVLHFGGDRRRERAVFVGGGVNFGRPVVTNGGFATRSSQITLRTCSYSDAAYGCRILVR